MSNNSQQSNTFHRPSNSRLVEVELQQVAPSDAQPIMSSSSSTSGLHNHHSNISTPSQTNSLVRIIDVQKRPQHLNDNNQAYQLEGGIDANSIGDSSLSYCRNRQSEGRGSLASSSQQQFVQSATDQQPRWTPSTSGKVTDRVKQQSGETLSSFESDYDLLVYLGETETEDIVETERSLDYQDQTWRQSICGGASLAPTIDESLSELATPTGFHQVSGGYHKEAQQDRRIDECDLLFSPSPYSAASNPARFAQSSSGVVRQRSNQNIHQHERSRVNQTGRAAATTLPRSISQIGQKQAAGTQDSDAECDHEVSLVFKNNETNQQVLDGISQKVAQAKQPPTRETTGQVQDQQQQKFSNIGNKIVSLFNRKVSPPIRHSDQQFSGKSNTLAAMETSSTGRQIRPEFKHQQSLRDGDEAIPTDEANELDRLLAEMSQSLDLNSLARYDTNPAASVNFRPGQQKSSQSLGKVYNATLDRQDVVGRSDSRFDSPRSKISDKNQAESLSRNFSVISNEDTTRSKSELAAARTIQTDPIRRNQQQASSDSILDEYDGASRILEQIISDQLKESAARRSHVNLKQQDYYSSQSMESRESPSQPSVLSARKLDHDSHRVAASPVTIGSTSGQPSVVDKVADSQQSSMRKLSDCSSSVATDPGMILVNKVSEPKKRENFENRSVWGHRRSTTTSRGKQTSQRSLDQAVSGDAPLDRDNHQLVESTRSLQNQTGVVEHSAGIKRRKEDMAATGRQEQATPTSSESRPPSLPEKDYSDMSVIRVEAADYSSSSSDHDEDARQQTDAETNMSKMKRRTLSSMRSMRDKLMNGFNKVSNPSQMETNTHRSQVKDEANNKLPQPPKRSSSINSRESSARSSPTKRVEDSTGARQQDRLARRDMMNQRRQRSFGEQIKERLNRSKSRLSSFLRQTTTRSRAQSSPNTKPTKEEEVNDDSRLFQPSDIARNSEDPNEKSDQGIDSFGESLDRHLKVDLKRRVERKSSSSSSLLSGLDLSKEQQHQQQVRPSRSKKNKGKVDRSSSLISLKRLGSLKSKQHKPVEVDANDLDAMTVSTTNDLPQARGRDRRKRNRERNKSSNKTDSDETSSRVSPVQNVKLVATHDYFGQGVSAQAGSRLQPELDKEDPANLQKSARSLNLVGENRDGKHPMNRSQSMKSVNEQEVDKSRDKRTLSSSNLNRRLLVTTNTFRPVSVNAGSPAREETGLHLAATPTREAITPIGYGSPEPIRRDENRLNVPTDSSPSRGRKPSPIRAKSAAMFEDIKHRCNEFLRSPGAKRKLASNDIDRAAKPPIAPPRRNAPRRSKSVAARRVPSESDDVVCVEAASPTHSMLNSDGEQQVPVKNKDKFMNLAQQIKQSATGLFAQQPQPRPQSASDHKRSRSVQRPTAIDTTGETTNLLEWKPVITSNKPSSTGRFNSAGLRKLVKDKEYETGQASGLQCHKDKDRTGSNRQQSLDTDTTWESSFSNEEEEGDTNNNHTRRTMIVHKCNDSTPAGLIQADEMVDLQPARDIVAPDKVAASTNTASKLDSSTTDVVGIDNVSAWIEPPVGVRKYESGAEFVGDKESNNNNNNSTKQMQQVGTDEKKTLSSPTSLGFTKKRSSIPVGNRINNPPVKVESARFSFSADLPSPAQALSDKNSSGDRKDQQEGNEEQSSDSIEQTASAKQVAADSSILNSQQEADMVAVAKCHPQPHHQQSAAKERDFPDTNPRIATQFDLKTTDWVTSDESSRVEGSEEEKRLSVYENMDDASMVSSLGQCLVAKINDIGKSSSSIPVRQWRKQAQNESKSQERKNTQSNNISARCNDETNSWSVEENDSNYRIDNLNNMRDLQSLKSKITDSNDQQEDQKDTQNEEPPAKPNRRLITRTSIYQDPNDELMQQVCSVSKPGRDLQKAIAEREAGGSVNKQLTRRDSTLSSLGQDHENNSDSDSSFTAAATSRQRLLSKFEKQSQNNQQQKPKFPPFCDGGKLARGSTGGGSLVKRLARNFDNQVVNNQELPPQGTSSPASRGKVSAGCKQVITTARVAQSPLKLVEDEPRSESTWYDAKSSETLDEAEVAEFLLDFERDDEPKNHASPPLASPVRLSEPTSISTGAEPFVTVAESTLEDDDNDLRCDIVDSENQQTCAIDVTLDDDDTLNDDEDAELGHELDRVDYPASYNGSDGVETVEQQGKDDDDDNNSNLQPASCSSQEMEQQQRESQAKRASARRRDCENEEGVRGHSSGVCGGASDVVVVEQKYELDHNKQELQKTNYNSKDDNRDEDKFFSKTAQQHLLTSQNSDSISHEQREKDKSIVADNKFRNSLNNLIASRRSSSQHQGAPCEEPELEINKTADMTAALDEDKRELIGCDRNESKERRLKGLSKYYHALFKHGRRKRKHLRIQGENANKGREDYLVRCSSSSSSSSACSSAISSPITSEDEADLEPDNRRERDNKKLVRAAKKCSRLYDELEKILANRATKEQLQLHLEQQSSTSSSSAPNNQSNPDAFCEDDFVNEDNSTSSTIFTDGKDDLISLSSSSMSSESIPEVKQRQNLQKLYHVVNEIYSSEAKFVDSLKLLNVDFRQHVQTPVRSSSLSPIPIENLASMLKHFPQLQALNENLLTELKQARDRWPQTQKIAHVLVKIGPFLKHYSTYIRDFESIQQQLNDNIKKYPQFGERVREFEASSRCQKLTVQHHLLKPIQRIPQYRLLLQQYLHNLKPDDVDYEDTVNALEVVSRVAEHANQAMNEGANFAKLLALQAKIVGKQRDIVQPGRLFVKEGELMKVCRKQVQPRWFILLNDALLYLTQIQSSDILYLNSEHPLDDCQVSTPKQDPDDPTATVGQHHENEFNVCTRTRSFALIAKSRSERDDWISTFKQTIDEHMARRRSFSVRQQQQLEMEHPQGLALTGSSRPQSCELGGSSQQLLGHSAPLWTPDARATMCQLCTSSFSALFRRHHCRACGRVVCSACSSNKAPLIYLKCRAARVCDECFDILKANIHLYYLPNAPAEVGEPELRRLDEHFRTLLKSQFVRCRFAIYMRRNAKQNATTK